MAQLVDRAFRDWLEPADDQPPRLVLAQSIDTDDLVGISYDASLIGPEELELIGPGTLLELDSGEEVVVADIDEDNDTIDFQARGVNGTTPAAQASGTFMYPHRPWRRQVVFDALADAVVNLYPDLYRKTTSDAMTIASTSYTEVDQDDVDAGFVGAFHFLGTYSGTTAYDTYAVEVINPAPMVTSGIAVVVSDLPSSATGYLVYKAKFLRPTLHADDLTEDFGVLPEYERIAILDAVAYLIAGRELDLATQERLSKQLEQQGYAAGTPSRIRDSMLRYRELLLDRAKTALRDQTDVIVTMNVAL